ncbi:hypothetical protein B0T10DRAFT_97339 [Thelonectria olida]|uniref:C2H2-type domain-containing protein n=1 Tax=Thelonectria olida TaxID=1576542 RepID=A0A9P9ALI7_9HYPO|nr:hypothetical protein B0T10DRAFT_97339 [Thelonectria olida]
MAYPSLPSIRIPSADGYRNHGSHHDRTYGSSIAMPIPGLDTQNDVPPPLPPPRYLPGTEPKRHEDMRDPREQRDFGRSPASFASGYGSMASSFAEERPSFLQRGIRGFNDRDEGYSSYSTDRSRDSGPRFSPLHSAFKFQSPAETYCDSMKKRLDSARHTDKAPSRSLLSASMDMLPGRNPAEQRIPPPAALSLPFHPRPVLDTPMHSTISPRAGPFYGGDRSPVESDMDHSPQTRTKRNNSDDATSTQGSYYGEDMEIEETSSLKRLHIDDAYVVGGQKRRAASPQDEHLLASQIELARRSRGSPEPRLGLSTIPQGAPISSVPSTSRSMSYMSSISVPPSSITSANSFGRRSPGLSPGGISPKSCNSPYNAPMSLNPSPRASISGRGAAHSRTVSSASSRKMEVPKQSGPKLQEMFMCDCCPKKPKRFETAEELQAHAAEKQYNCSFCGNRFKNKNEAERHQNSLHVRRHSWSCSALSGYDRAFHESTHRPGEADACGYCGEDFYRSGRGPGANAPKHATDKDWDERIRHLQETHKFRECNSSKKFYRADHFRQHLKHSHAGTSGKWTNMLENACMLEEDPTPR